MAQHAMLKRTVPELATIGGIGDFAEDLPALPVSDSIGHEYDTPEMQELGWVVEWVAAPERETEPEPDPEPEPEPEPDPPDPAA